MHLPVVGESREGRDTWQAYLQTEEKIIQGNAVAFLAHGPFCNPRVRPPSMQAGQDEITNNRLMTFSPRPVQCLEKSHPVLGFRGENIVADQSGIFPLKWLTMALRETRMGYVPPSFEEMARADYDSLAFAMLRTFYGKCTRHCQWLLEKLHPRLLCPPTFPQRCVHMLTMQNPVQLQA